MPDKKQTLASQTGEIPRVEAHLSETPPPYEPNPSPPVPEPRRKPHSTTGIMPIVAELVNDDSPRDEDDPIESSSESDHPKS